MFVYISTSGCQYVWTGGWTSQPGIRDAFVWLYTSDVNGQQEQMNYQDWRPSQPNGGNHGQQALRLKKGYDYSFTDADMIQDSTECFICEC